MRARNKDTARDAIHPSNVSESAMNSRQRFSVDVSVFVIVREGTRILFLRRAHTGWKDGFFSLPAGGHDGNETLAQAAARELREETGLIAAESELALAHLLHCRVGEKDSEWLGAFFEARIWRGVPELMEPGKHDRLEWLDPRNLPAHTIPYVAQALEAVSRGVQFSGYGWPAPA